MNRILMKYEKMAERIITYYQFHGFESWVNLLNDSVKLYSGGERRNYFIIEIIHDRTKLKTNTYLKLEHDEWVLEVYCGTTEESLEEKFKADIEKVEKLFEAGEEEAMRIFKKDLKEIDNMQEKLDKRREKIINQNKKPEKTNA